MNVEVIVLCEVECFSEEVLHLLLKICVELRFELLFRDVISKTIVVNFFVVFFHSKSEYCFLQSLSLESVHLR